jgi:hypothetical protein
MLISSHASGVSERTKTMDAQSGEVPPEEYAASVAASLSRLLTSYAVDSQAELEKQAGTSRVEAVMASFASDMASIAANPASEAERLTASVAASMAYELAARTKVFTATAAASVAGLLTGYTIDSQASVFQGGDTTQVASAMASFASEMASIAANPDSELERLSASTSASVADLLASYARSLGIEEQGS